MSLNKCTAASTTILKERLKKFPHLLMNWRLKYNNTIFISSLSRKTLKNVQNAPLQLMHVVHAELQYQMLLLYYLFGCYCRAWATLYHHTVPLKYLQKRKEEKVPFRDPNYDHFSKLCSFCNTRIHRKENPQSIGTCEWNL